MFKRQKLFLVKTYSPSKIGNLVTIDDKNIAFVKTENIEFNHRVKYHNLYSVSDDTIKLGDYFIQADGGNGEPILRKLVTETEYYNEKQQKDYYPYFSYDEEFLNQGCYKVTITTNIDLIGFPRFSSAFLSKYALKRNQQEPIDEIMVKYEDRGEEMWMGDDFSGQPYWREDIQIKVDSNDIVTIKKVIDSWNKEQLRELAIYFKSIVGNEKDNAWLSKHNRLLDSWIRRNS